jgi:hypothetical protein
LFRWTVILLVMKTPCQKLLKSWEMIINLQRDRV